MTGVDEVRANKLHVVPAVSAPSELHVVPSVSAPTELHVVPSVSAPSEFNEGSLTVVLHGMPTVGETALLLGRGVTKVFPGRRFFPVVPRRPLDAVLDES